MIRISIKITLLFLTAFLTASPSETLPQRLGYPADARLLIVHADDVGVSHSVNRATFDALQTGLVNSASIMMTCPWVPEVVAFARQYPETDFGLHLTLTAEWEHYKWGTVASAEAVPSLLDPFGYLYPTVEAAVPHIDPAEAEREIRAQISLARAMGIEPTHLDSHMGTLFATPELTALYLRVGREYGLPVLAPRNLTDLVPHFQSLLTPDDVVIDRLAMMQEMRPASEWDDFYADVVRNLEPGVTEIIVHLAYDDEEMQAVTYNHPDWGAAWRQRDFDFFTSRRFRRLLEEQRIQLITWREIKDKLIQ